MVGRGSRVAGRRSFRLARQALQQPASASKKGITRKRTSCSRTSIINPPDAPSNTHWYSLRPSSLRVLCQYQIKRVTANSEVACDHGGAMTV